MDGMLSQQNTRIKEGKTDMKIKKKENTKKK